MISQDCQEQGAGIGILLSFLLYLDMLLEADWQGISHYTVQSNAKRRNGTSENKMDG